MFQRTKQAFYVYFYLNAFQTKVLTLLDVLANIFYRPPDSGRIVSSTHIATKANIFFASQRCNFGLNFCHRKPFKSHRLWITFLGRPPFVHFSRNRYTFTYILFTRFQMGLCAYTHSYNMFKKNVLKIIKQTMNYKY